MTPTVTASRCWCGARPTCWPLVPELKQPGYELAGAEDIDALAGFHRGARPGKSVPRLNNPLDRVAWLALLRAPWCPGWITPTCWPWRGQQGAPPSAAAGRRSDTIGLSGDGALRLGFLRDGLQDIVAQRERLSAARLDGNGLAAAGWSAMCVEDASQLEDAEAFFSMLSVLEASRGRLHPGKLDQHVAKLFAQNASATDSKLQLMTMHKAKGLEFDWCLSPTSPTLHSR